MTMSPNVPSAPTLQHFASVSDVTNIVRDFRSASPTYRPFKGKIPPKWHKAAGKKGYDITGRVKGRLHVALLCHDCGNTHTKRISVVLGYHPECPHCIQQQRIGHARAAGAFLLGRDPKDRHYGHYRLNCGHQVKRQFHRVALAAKGGHALGCDACRENRYREQARKFGWDLIGPASNSKRGYRQYQHVCGQMQDITIGNMVWGDCKCKKCSSGRTTRPSHIYLFRIDLPGLPVVKLGYSARPSKRLRHQLGIDKNVNTEVLRVVNLPTGHDARAEEERAHRTLQARFPDNVVAKSEYGDAINVTPRFIVRKLFRRSTAYWMRSRRGFRTTPPDPQTFPFFPLFFEQTGGMPMPYPSTARDSATPPFSFDLTRAVLGLIYAEQRLLQASLNPLLKNYEHAQDLAGEAFAVLGIARGERRAEARRIRQNFQRRCL